MKNRGEKAERGFRDRKTGSESAEEDGAISARHTAGSGDLFAELREAVEKVFENAGFDENKEPVYTGLSRAELIEAAAEFLSKIYPTEQVEKALEDLAAGARAELYKTREVLESEREHAKLVELPNKEKPVYTETMRDAKHDLNALAANLGLTFEEAAQNLTEAARSKFDPLRVARRVVKSFDRRREKNPDLPEPREVKAARRIVNHDNYLRQKAKAHTL
jgi:hypothetical protein